MTQQEIMDAIQRQKEIILDREALLRSRDYIGVKIAMGVATKKDYSEEIAETEQWRADINSAQEELTRLQTVEPDDPDPVGEVDATSLFA